jgi:hypothetical protein
MRNAIFWDVTPCGYCTFSRRVSVVSYGNVVPSSPLLAALMMEAIRSSEMWTPTRATRRDILEDGIIRNSS